MTGALEQTLADEIEAIADELSGLSLEKAHRDRRLELNTRLEQKKAQLAAMRQRSQVEVELARVAAELQAGPAAPRRRELQRERARLEGRLVELKGGTG